MPENDPHDQTDPASESADHVADKSAAPSDQGADSADSAAAAPASDSPRADSADIDQSLADIDQLSQALAKFTQTSADDAFADRIRQLTPEASSVQDKPGDQPDFEAPPSSLDLADPQQTSAEHARATADAEPTVETLGSAAHRPSVPSDVSHAFEGDAAGPDDDQPDGSAAAEQDSEASASGGATTATDVGDREPESVRDVSAREDARASITAKELESQFGELFDSMGGVQPTAPRSVGRASAQGPAAGGLVDDQPAPSASPGRDDFNWLSAQLDELLNSGAQDSASVDQPASPQTDDASIDGAAEQDDPTLELPDQESSPSDESVRTDDLAVSTIPEPDDGSRLEENGSAQTQGVSGIDAQEPAAIQDEITLTERIDAKTSGAGESIQSEAGGPVVSPDDGLDDLTSQLDDLRNADVQSMPQQAPADAAQNAALEIETAPIQANAKAAGELIQDVPETQAQVPPPEQGLVEIDKALADEAAELIDGVADSAESAPDEDLGATAAADNVAESETMFCESPSEASASPDSPVEAVDETRSPGKETDNASEPAALDAQTAAESGNDWTMETPAPALGDAQSQAEASNESEEQPDPESAPAGQVESKLRSRDGAEPKGASGKDDDEDPRASQTEELKEAAAAAVRFARLHGALQRIEPVVVPVLRCVNYPLRYVPQTMRPIVDWIALSLLFWVPIVWVIALLSG